MFRSFGRAAALLGATVAVGLGGTAVAAPVAYHHGSSVQAVSSSCPSGYTSAWINGAHKCLRAGEFCTHSADSQYRRYGFRCIRYYPNVRRYRLTHA
jgi:hypothetical protein